MHKMKKGTKKVVHQAGTNNDSKPAPKQPRQQVVSVTHTSKNCSHKGYV